MGLGTAVLVQFWSSLDVRVRTSKAGSYDGIDKEKIINTEEDALLPLNPGKIIDNENIKVHTAEIEQDLGGKITLVTNIHVHIATETTVEPYPGEGSINSESRRSGHTQEEIQETARMAQMQEEIQETTRMAQMQEEITQYDPGGRAEEIADEESKPIKRARRSDRR